MVVETETADGGCSGIDIGLWSSSIALQVSLQAKDRKVAGTSLAVVVSVIGYFIPQIACWSSSKWKDVSPNVCV